MKKNVVPRFSLFCKTLLTVFIIFAVSGVYGSQKDKSDREIVSLIIRGPSTLRGNTHREFTCRAKYANGKTAKVQAKWEVSNTGSAVFCGNVLYAKSRKSSRKVTITAVYNKLSATREITIKGRAVDNKRKRKSSCSSGSSCGVRRTTGCGSSGGRKAGMIRSMGR